MLLNPLTFILKEGTSLVNDEYGINNCPPALKTALVSVLITTFS